MTVIVGLKHNGNIYIGGDSAGVRGYEIRQRNDTKVFIKGSFIFGYTTSFRMGQILRFAFEPPKRKNGTDIFEYMCTSFINELRKTFKNHGFFKNDHGTDQGGEFIVGYASRLFSIESDFQVAEIVDDFTACGCAHDLAMGSMFSTKDLIKDPNERILMALKAAERYSSAVSMPFVIEKLESNKVKTLYKRIRRKDNAKGNEY